MRWKRLKNWNIVVMVMTEVREREECGSLGARKCHVKVVFAYVSLVLQQVLIERPKELELKTSSEVRLDVQKIMWTLDASKT